MRGLWDERFTPADAEIIKRKARKLAGHYGYRASDVEDIEQDLATHVFQQTHRHLPERGSREKFVSKVAKNKLLNLIEKRTAMKRGDGRNVSVDEAGERALLDGSISPDSLDVVIDVRAVIVALPDELRQVALLRQQHSQKELEGLLHLTRAQVRCRIQHLECIFREAGLAPDSERQQPNLTRFR
jgi:DNA-directed RNA polymerase specialized sigma24 family protein